MINMSFWFGRDTKRRVLVCLLLRKKKFSGMYYYMGVFDIVRGYAAIKNISKLF